MVVVVLPPMTPQERSAIRLPRSLHQLQELSQVFSKYNEEHVIKVMLVWVSVFHFIQAFSIPGSMYLTILAGALWKHRIDAWKSVTQQYQHHMLSYLTMLRMMPIPPHFLVNIMAPHLGISLSTFWPSTLLGVCCSSLVYTALGEELGQLAGPHAFRLFTWRNGMLIVLVLIAATLPGLLKSWIQAPEAQAAPGPIRLDDTSMPALRPLRMLPRTFRSWIQRIYPNHPSHFTSHTPFEEEEADESTSAWRTVEREMPSAHEYDPEVHNEETQYDRPWHRSEHDLLLSYVQRASEFAGQTPSTLRSWWDSVQQRA
ncbi:hypothetical protein MEQU1_002038 [Malassezia equina]|uniref:Golgi apparatus membrane protein tvp38 n=1 Tax=Malassezia equina TaxID=1381935 RepID=A0AAF0IYW3_9BASI|nr:hypothetical protein MEQU1_002038 [Malassezia equina]